jgi:outer membrane receptor protein involved in Fe transport
LSYSKNFISKTLLLLITLSSLLYAGETGKISGVITDDLGDPVIGANVLVQGTHFGAAADIDGYFYINNVPPGTYTLVVSSVGYAKTRVNEVVVRIDLTTNVDVKLLSESLQLGQDVVVTAEKPLITKDLTSTKATISSSEIALLPVDNVNQVINLQAGVVDGHFRGGRQNEVAYLVDGIPVTDVFSGSQSLQVENSSIRELEVISGTFNAEYGQALSGVVNIVTKEGTQKYEGSVTAYAGTYYSTDTDVFENLDQINTDGVRDVSVSVSGPAILRDLSFFATGRYFRNDGYFYGKRVYNVTDINPLNPTGDGEKVRMSNESRNSFNGKLTYSLPSWKFSYGFFWDDSENKYYDHAFKWAPDGLMTHFGEDIINNFQIAFYPSQSTFTTLKFSANKFRFKGYLYEDAYDSRYIDPQRGTPTSAYTFRHGGQQSNRYSRWTNSYIGQWNIESQLSKEHKVKLGVEGQYHEIFNHGTSIVNLTEGQVDENGNLIFTLGYRDPGTPGNQSFLKYPYQFAAFIQDKMEYDIMIINAGLRLDYFNPNTNMPADLRNPSRVNPNPNFPGAGQSVEVESKYQVSPRIGVSFPISDQGAIYFSYGHFFQIPNFENLYRNNEYIIDQGQSLNSITGNPDLDAQKTVKYELGLQQVLFPNISLDATVYYSDIRNLLGMEIKNTYEGFKYARFINKDYGNVKGIILTLDKRFADFFSLTLDYTYQIAEGNSSDPFSVYNDNQSDPPVESEKKVVPLNWDQRSTVNLQATFGQPGDWTVGTIISYGSGNPYTEDIRVSNGVRFENGGRKPNTISMDLKADKFFELFGLKLHGYLLVYNLLDIRNEYGVYGTTGRANSDLNTKFAGDINGLNTIDEFVNNPGNYSAPRQVRLGISFGF